jgi:hypothetical protein
MYSKLIFLALLGIATAASGQTVYRTVTNGGKVIYSDTGGGIDSTTRLAQTRRYSMSDSASGDAPRGEDGGGSDGAKPCRADVQKYCAQAGGGKQTFDCLLDHQQDVSDACYDALKQRMQAGQGSQDEQQNPGGQGGQGVQGGQNAPQGARECKQDFERLCKNVQPGGGRIVNCLLDHQNDLSDACYDALAQKMKKGRQ